MEWIVLAGLLCTDELLGMEDPPVKQRYNLHVRTQRFANRVRLFVHRVPKTISTESDCKQLVRASGSVAANYGEADEASSRRDFAAKLKICKKEARECIVWLNLLNVQLPPDVDKERIALLKEADELVRIFFASIRTAGFSHI